MSNQLYQCENCKKIFFYPKGQGDSGLCRSCLQKTLKEMIKIPILVCSLCHRQFDGTVFIEYPEHSHSKFNIINGKVRCPNDNNPLELRAFKEKTQSLKQEAKSQVPEIQKSEIDEENAFLSMLNRYKEDMIRDIETNTAIQISSDSPSASVGAASSVSESVSQSTSMEVQEVTRPVIEEITNIIEPINFSELFPTPIPNLPLTEEFWEYYYIQERFSSPDKFLGNQNATKKIQKFINEIEKFLFGSMKGININSPILENLKNGNVIYIGDTHGRIQDTHKIIKFCVNAIKKAKNTGKDIRIIFTGDYVDRNEMDIHNLLYILAFAMKYPQYVRLLRGNHEEVTINMQYGFWENINQYLPNSYLFNNFEYLFQNLPMMHVIQINNKRIMGLHGGIPFYDQGFETMPEIPKLMTGLDELDCRHPSIDEMDVLSQQILWSDPADQLPPYHFYLPSPRGMGFTFGQEVFEEWCKVNFIDRVVRGHEVFMEGYREFFNQRLFSIFSNSDYVKRKIKAKILEFDLEKPWEKNWKYYTIQKDL